MTSRLALASVSRRVVAFLIDGFIISTISIIISFVTFFLGLFTIAAENWFRYGDNPLPTEQHQNILTTTRIILLFYIAVVFLIMFLYFFLPQWKLHRTLGQKILGIRVISKSNSKNINSKQAFLRIFPLFLAVFISFITSWMQYVALAIIVIDCGWYYIRPGRQTLHDYLSNTTVERV